jgi:purine-binding chemotaxis protein CheW
MSDQPLPPPGGRADDRPPAGAAYIMADLGRRPIAVPLAALLEVTDLDEVALAPLAPRWLLGVANLRGAVVPVVELATLLGWEAETPGRRALVLRDGRFRLALPVNAVHAVRWLEPGPAIDEAPAGAAMAGEPAIARQAPVDDRPIWIVDAEAVLARVRQGEPVGVAGR